MPFDKSNFYYIILFKKIMLIKNFDRNQNFSVVYLNREKLKMNNCISIYKLQ